MDVQDRGEPRFVGCERCGADLTLQAVSKAVHCERFGVPCANACGLSRKMLDTGNPGTCQNRVAPDRWHALESDLTREGLRATL